MTRERVTVERLRVSCGNEMPELFINVLNATEEKMEIDVDELKARIKEDRRKATPTYGLHNDTPDGYGRTLNIISDMIIEKMKENDRKKKLEQ